MQPILQLTAVFGHAISYNPCACTSPYFDRLGEKKGEQRDEKPCCGGEGEERGGDLLAVCCEAIACYSVSRSLRQKNGAQPS